MNPSPFHPVTKFLAKDAREDKIDLKLSGWRIKGIEHHPDDVLRFKKAMSCPPAGEAEKAWSKNGKPPVYGSFFNRPHAKGKNRSKLTIRKAALIDKTDKQKPLRHEAPLCGGHCLFYLDKSSEVAKAERDYLAELVLSLNLQRFIRHQPDNDTPSKPHQYWLKRRNDDRSVHGEERSFDGEDNWIPNTPEWSKFAREEHLSAYVALIAKELEDNLNRACKQELAGTLPDDDFGWAEEVGVIQYELEKEKYTLSTVETAWEFPAPLAAMEVWEIGAKLIHLKRDWGFARFNDVATKQAARIKDSPCISIPLAESAFLRLYAKTNRRIRFEVVQSNLGKQLSALRKAAKLPEEKQGWNEIPKVMSVLRERAAAMMNQVMKELLAKQDYDSPAKSLVHLLSELAAAVPFSLPTASRFDQIQSLLVLLCFQKGYRGNIKSGASSQVLITLEERGVLKFDRRRQFYVLAPEFMEAADALLSLTGEPLLSIFGKAWNGYDLSPEGKLVHLRE